jgi:hypothetical protein
VGFQRVGTDAQNLDVQLFKTRDVVLKSLHFTGSARGEIGIVICQNHRPFQQ